MASELKQRIPKPASSSDDEPDRPASDRPDTPQSPVDGDDPSRSENSPQPLERHPESETDTDQRNPASKSRKKPAYFSHTFLIHTVIRSSPLSSESPEQNYRGFYNLTVLCLFVLNVRLVIENYQKYGFLLQFPTIGAHSNDLFFCLLAFPFMAGSVFVALALEKNASKKLDPRNPTPTAVWLSHWANITLALATPTLISWFLIWHPAIAAVPVFAATILFLKLISYMLVCAELRREMAQKIHPTRYEDRNARQFEVSEPVDFDIDQVPYPSNITLGNLLYFVAAPTLVYQPSYPRSAKFSKSELVKRVMELTMALFGMYFLTHQYMAPTLRNSLTALDELSALKLTERILKLSIINVLVWLLMFYAFFHSFLNLNAEILGFGDRRFYQSWWNATDIAEYWRLWNSPVYNWGKRHVYLPLVINYKVPPVVASVVIFLISAVLHELIIGVPVHSISGLAFWGMLGQIPLIFLTKWLMAIRSLRFNRRKKLFDTIGNLVFWISFTIVGQPTAILLYYSTWYRQNVINT
ncbi:MBOAT, membrane-bound O-acyltransferase family-domain-containing protein [Polychytrium aggregatum]|uniref:MBOAT, membrane-bound O-acyltransferase family-domain-containing protein n=1 Tax=Polychytrium aggregatum TaxID=110093 RepID=UPI0022FDC2ED|nr:MBOAT, membrane-bound O-acyltransferase family-domain-containing protein [Polychytrium aggregatum]KAI9202546.1 MBOAT, membrane-bound O-acyltransferase family-domain-containing protein [Polychytrium aggregatum]